MISPLTGERRGGEFPDFVCVRCGDRLWRKVSPKNLQARYQAAEVQRFYLYSDFDHITGEFRESILCAPCYKVYGGCP